MSYTLSDLKKKVVRLLGDVVTETEDDNPCDSPIISGAVYAKEIIEDGIHAAIQRVSTKIWKTAYLDVDEEDATEVALPNDVIDIEGVFDNNLGRFIPRMQFSQETILAVSTTNSNAWIDYPGSYITFLTPLSDTGARIYYLTHWDLPLEEDDVLECPDCCVTAICLYAASYCLLRSAAESGDISQWRTKVDSGKPTDIPAQALSDFFLKRFENELATLPAKTRNG